MFEQDDWIIWDDRFFKSIRLGLEFIKNAKEKLDSRGNQKARGTQKNSGCQKGRKDS